MLFRKHRGSLDDAMITCIPVKTKKDIADYCSDKLITFDPELIKVKYYCYDDRIQWDTYIVIYPDYGPLGFTNGNLI